MKRPEGFDPALPPDSAESQPKQKRERSKPEKQRAPQPKTLAPSASRQPASSVQRPERLQRSTKPAVIEAAAASDSRHERRAQARDARREARREARRFTRDSRRRRLTIASLIGVVVVLLGVLAVAVFSPILALRTIRVEGTSIIPASSVQDALSSQLGTPLALLNDDQIRYELSHLILIRSYVTEVVPPNTLVVRIVERKAIGVLHRGSGYQQVDPAGVVLATSATPAGLPIIDIGSAGVNSAGFAAAVKVLLAMPASMLAQVGTISATTLDNVSVTLSQGSHIVEWGSSAQSDLKATALAILLKNPTCSAQTVLNVTAPLALACGPVQPTATPTPSPTTTPAG